MSTARDPSAASALADLADASRHLASIWTTLANATKSPDSAFRTPSLATIDLDGSPRSRTVVVRSVDAGARELRIFTDARSSKVAQLSSDGRASLVCWDASTQVQLRISGECMRLYDESAIIAAWKGVPESNRVNYRTTLSPGESIPTSDAVKHIAGDGYENFAVLVFVAASFDWLWLDRAGHRRCRFDLSTGERRWIVP